MPSWRSACCGPLGVPDEQIAASDPETKADDAKTDKEGDNKKTATAIVKLFATVLALVGPAPADPPKEFQLKSGDTDCHHRRFDHGRRCN